ncbi:MAG: hypothetical protein NT062_24335 [Proteobacteria bacterium]|nr:hypothetical protein [Pseudomonadota bacterium]
MRRERRVVGAGRAQLERAAGVTGLLEDGDAREQIAIVLGDLRHAARAREVRVLRGDRRRTPFGEEPLAGRHHHRSARICELRCRRRGHLTDDVEARVVERAGAARRVDLERLEGLAGDAIHDGIARPRARREPPVDDGAVHAAPEGLDALAGLAVSREAQLIGADRLPRRGLGDRWRRRAR